MATITVKLNHKGVQALLKSKQVESALVTSGNRVANQARNVVPVRSGQLRDSIKVVADQTPTRARVRVVLDTPYAAKVAATNPAIAASLDTAGE